MRASSKHIDSAETRRRLGLPMNLSRPRTPRTSVLVPALLVVGLAMAGCSNSDSPAGDNPPEGSSTQPPSVTSAETADASPSLGQATPEPIPPSPRAHQIELTSALEKTGLVEDLRLGDTGGPDSASALADSVDGAVTYTISLTLTVSPEPLGDYVVVSDTLLDGWPVLLLDRGGVDTVWFRCTDERALEVRSTPNDGPRVDELAAALHDELSCG